MSFLKKPSGQLILSKILKDLFIAPIKLFDKEVKIKTLPPLEKNFFVQINYPIAKPNTYRNADNPNYYIRNYFPHKK